MFYFNYLNHQMHKEWQLDGYHKAVLTMVRGKTRLTLSILDMSPSPSLKL